MTKNILHVLDTHIGIYAIQKEDYISLTDIAKHKSTSPDQVIQNWMRNRNTLEFLGLREKVYNSDFKPLEFEGFRMQA